MPDLFASFDWTPSVVLPLLLAAMTAGLVRGFAGFGAGLILMPIASSVIDPRLAAAMFLVVDTVITLPLLPSAVRKAHWPTVVPLAIGALCLVPFGAWVLINADVSLLRWAIPILILAMLMLLLSGWRYHGAPIWPASLGVGAVAGLLGGVAQIAGPPVVSYWMAGPLPAATIRANLITFFAIATVGSVASYLVGGLFTAETLGYIAVVAPVYALAIWLGTRAFAFASDRTFRRIAYVMIALAAITSLPVLDGILRG